MLGDSSEGVGFDSVVCVQKGLEDLRVNVSLTHKSLLSVSFVGFFNAFSTQNNGFVNAARPDCYKNSQSCLFHSTAIYFCSFKPNAGPLIITLSCGRALWICIVLPEGVVLWLNSYHVVIMFSLLFFRVQFI